MRFVRIICDGAQSAFYNMALDEAIISNVRELFSPPTLRFYTWDRPSVSIGRFQKHAEIDHAYCRKKGYPMVRRPTGGRAILHSEELTYSFSSRFDSLLFKGTLFENYALVSRALISGLQKAGLMTDAAFSERKSRPGRSVSCFSSLSYGEITIEKRKVIGSAQKRYTDAFLQQGSILIDIDEKELIGVFSIKEKENFDHMGALKDHLPAYHNDMLISAFKESFEETFEVKLIADTPTEDEVRMAEELVSAKYATEAWNELR